MALSATHSAYQHLLLTSPEISWDHVIDGFTKLVTESELTSPIQLLLKHLQYFYIINHFCLLKIQSRIRFLQSQDTALFASSIVSETREGFSPLETSQPPIRIHSLTKNKTTKHTTHNGSIYFISLSPWMLNRGPVNNGVRRRIAPQHEDATKRQP
jgi:hypothetical protein